MEIKLTTTQYAHVRSISTAAVRKAIAKKHALPGVIRTGRMGRPHVLTIDVPTLALFLKVPEKKLRKNLEVTIS